MTKQDILKRIALLEKQKAKLLKNFKAIVKRNDNDLSKVERENSILDIINEFNRQINELKKKLGS